MSTKTRFPGAMLAFLLLLEFCLPAIAGSGIQTTQILGQHLDFRKAEADRLLKQGNEQLSAIAVDAALKPLEQALVIYRELKDRSGEGQTLKSLGNAYYRLKNYQKAISYHQQALEIAQAIQDKELESRALLNLGLAHKELGNLAQAIAHYQKSLAIAQSIHNRELEWKSFYNLGEVYSEQEDHTQASQAYEQALPIATELNDKSIRRQILSKLGFAYAYLGDTNQSINTQQQSLAIARELKDHFIEATTLNALADLQRNLKNYSAAIDYSEQSLAISRTSKKLSVEQARLIKASALQGLGVAYDGLADFAQAVKFYEQSLALIPELKNTSFKPLASQLEEITLSSLALSYALQGNAAKEIEYRQRDLAIAKESNNVLRQGKNLHKLGDIFLEKSDFISAISHLEQSLSIAQKLKNISLESASLLSLGIIYFSLGEFNKAIEYDEKNLKLIQEFNKKQEGKVISSARQKLLINEFREKEVLVISKLGSDYLYGGKNSEEARRYFELNSRRVKELNLPELEDTALSGLGTFFSFTGDHQKAIDYYKRALNLIQKAPKSQFSRFDESSKGSLLNFIARAHALNGQPVEAIQYAQQSLAIAQSHNNPFATAGAFSNLGLVLLLADRYLEAEKPLYNALQGYESVRAGLGEQYSYKVSLFEQQREAYVLLEQVLVNQNKIEKALEITERSRARTLVELQAKRLFSRSTIQQTVKPLTVQQIQQIAKQQNSILVTYSIAYDPKLAVRPSGSTESEIFIWVIKPTGEIIFRKSDLKPFLQEQNRSQTLETFITSSRQEIGVRSPADVEVIARLDPNLQNNRLNQLHRILIEPIDDLLPKNPQQPVIFIPQQELFLVPFPALKDANGKYLIENHTILTAPSIQVLGQTRQLQQTKVGTRNLGNSLVLGNPTMPTVVLRPGTPAQRLTALPGAEKEAIAIASLLNTNAITGSHGTKATVVQKMPQANIIHFATHGILDDLRGLGSAIALAPDPTQTEEKLSQTNVLLTAEEILDMQLTADLVVLSACDTGRGRMTGDGVIGLSRSFISAGVPSIIVSLWAVPDAPTAELMTEFYKNWKQRNLDKAQALRQAMLTTLKTHPNPRDWAAFTLIGEVK